MKIFMKTLLCTMVLCYFPVCSFAETVQEIKWNDLVPPKYQIADPVAAFSQQVQEYVEWIIYLRQNLPKEITEKEKEFHDEMTAALPVLKEQGIDVDKIIAGRHERENSLNEKLNGKQVRLSGYLLPLDLSDKEIREFLLVPFVGACIHVPPPPPNQIVHAVSEKPIKYTMKDMFRPVAITGRLSAKTGTKNLFLGDGSNDVDIGYVMQVESIGEHTK